MYKSVFKYPFYKNIFKLSSKKCGSSLKILDSLENKLFSSSVQNVNKDICCGFEKGSLLHGFVVESVAEVPEIQLTAVRLKHVQTGADYLHLARNDSNNVFCIGFQTTPMDSTGVAHILEHNVLCGSLKFPCRDPFFKMLNRSLSTFMNAMTGADYTIYPFSTQNPIDYKNLMAVYLDAVFRPNLLELDFLQEGWRLEHENNNDQHSSIVFKGVVFNEMKGVFADSQNRFLQKLCNGILPSHTYGYVSGGEPLDIPMLTWQHLKEFHKTHYHPSNSRIFSYGDIPLEDHLNYIDREYLSKYERLEPNTFVPSEPRWTTSRRDHIECDFDPMTPESKQNTVAVSYMLNDITDDFENFFMSIVSHLLIDGPNSPFYKSLIESQLGSGFITSVGFDNHSRNTTFTVGLQGVESNKMEEVETLIPLTFETVIKEGFPDERIEAVLHSIELSMKHQTSNFGLGLAMNVTPFWNHNGDIMSFLKINSKIERFRNILKSEPNFLKNKISEYFLNNRHKYTLTMSPNKNFATKLIEAENALLKEKVQCLTEQEKSKIWELGKELKLKQEIEEDVSALPTLKVSDISRSIKSSNIMSESDVSQMSIQPTNGVTYFNAIISTNDIPENLIKYVPLFCNILTCMGASDLDFRALSQKAELITGGLGSGFHVAHHPHERELYEQGIHLSSYCLHKNLASMLDLWLKIINELKIDDESRFGTLLNMLATEQANSLVHNGHSYAMSYASSSTSYASHVQENSTGLTQILMLKEFCHSEDISVLMSKLKQLYEALVRKNSIRLSINVSSENIEDASRLMRTFASNLHVSNSTDPAFSDAPKDFIPKSQQTHHVLPFPINFCAKSYSNIPYSHPDSGALRVLARLMFRFLHREIREKGGAYGGGATASPGGPFAFYSYRDPNCVQTLNTFEEAINWVLSGSFEGRDIDEAKLGVFQKVDSPVPPGSVGLKKFLHHIDDEMHHDHRLSILNATSEDVVRVCSTYLNDNSFQGTCVIGPHNDTISKSSHWKAISHVL